MTKNRIITSILVGILFFNFFNIFPQIRREISIIRRNIFAGYNWKMEEKIGKNFYDYTLFLKKEIPEDAVIMIPPSRFPWPQTGNKYYLEYFLYPRKVIDWDESKIGKADYILALWGESEPIHEYASGFPKVDIVEKFIYCQNDDFSHVYTKENFVFKTDMKKGIWGFIKLR